MRAKSNIINLRGDKMSKKHLTNIQKDVRDIIQTELRRMVILIHIDDAGQLWTLDQVKKYSNGFARIAKLADEFSVDLDELYS